MGRQKVIIDCDPGIDDTMALFMAIAAHSKGELEIMAITLVSGNTSLDNCARNVTRVLETTNKSNQIPVYMGARKGLIHKYVFPEVPFHGSDGFNGTKFDHEPDTSRVKDGAASAILKLVNDNVNQIKMVALGPLTNVATCFIMDGDFWTKLAGLELMGGNSSGIGNVTSCAEFNFHADPEAAFVVMQGWGPEPARPIKIVPWETCLNGCYVDWDWRMGKLGTLGTDCVDLLNKLEKKWDGERLFGDQWILCDQLTMAVLIRPEVAKKSTTFKDCTVELHGLATRGMLAIEKRNFSDVGPMKSPKIDIVEEIDVDMLKELLCDLLGHEF